MLNKIFFKILRIIGFGYIFQKKNTSFKTHEKINYSKDFLEKDYLKIKLKHQTILKNFKSKYEKYLDIFYEKKKNKILLDIGAGQLIHTNFFSNFFNHIYSIEPSVKATKLGNKIYNFKKSKVTIVNSFIEEELNQKYFTNSNFVFSGHVLSHLTEDTFKKFCNCLNDKFRANSVFIFDELWTNNKELKDNMFYVRSKKKWEKYLSRWRLILIKKEVKIGNKIFYKGIIGKKLY